MTTHDSSLARSPSPAGSRTLTALVLACVVGACGARESGPQPPPPAPDLRGARVMLLPVRAPAPEPIDAELAFWLAERSPTTDWVLPDELQQAIDRAPAWRVRLEAMPRLLTDFGGGDRRIRDPLYGVLRQLGAVVDANYAVVPIEAVMRSDTLGTAVHLPVAVVDIRGGRVLWLHPVRSEPRADPRTAVAAVAEAVADALFP